MEWHPATIEDVREIIKTDLASCDPQQRNIFQKFFVEPYFAPIYRYDNLEQLVVVARKEDEVMYWEDIDGGFNISPTDSTGLILEHWCNQDELKHALTFWMDDQSRPAKCRPAQPIK